MSLQSRVEKLEQGTGMAGACPVCDAPRAEETPDYDVNKWQVKRTIEMNPACVRCGRPRRILLHLIEPTEESEAA